MDCLSNDYESAEIDARDAAMLKYAVNLTAAPHQISADDIVTLREHGFDDLAIHDICCITSYFAFANRIADGLGIELE